LRLVCFVTMYSISLIHSKTTLKRKLCLIASP
jgi:hypothetical protein